MKDMANSSKTRPFYWFFLLFAALIFWYLLPLMSLGTEHLRVVDAFNVDEGMFLWELESAFQQGSVIIGKNDYGHLYYNLILVIAYTLDLVFDVTPTWLIVIGRIISMLALLASSYILMQIGRKLNIIWAGVLSGLALLAVPNALHYATMLHPDTLQLFFILLSLSMALTFVKQPTINWFALGTLSAGAAFACKYGGVILIPIWLALWIYKPPKMSKRVHITSIVFFLVLWFFFRPYCIEPYLDQEGPVRDQFIEILSLLWWLGIPLLGVLLASLQSKWGKLLSSANRIAVGLILAVSFFTLAFAVTSPQSFYRWGFIDGFIMIAQLHKQGHWFEVSDPILGNINLLLGENGLGLFGGLLLLLGFIGAWLSVLLEGRKKRSALIILTSWLVLFTMTLLGNLGSQFLHYWIPFYPVFILLGFVGIGWRLERIPQFGKKWHYLAIVVLSSAFVFIVGARPYLFSRMSLHANSNALSAGEWLEEYLGNQDASVLADKYTYVKAQPNVSYQSVWGMDSTLIASLSPSFLVISNEIYKRYLPITDSSRFLYDKEQFLRRHNTYTKLLGDSLPGYFLVKKYPEIRVYESELFFHQKQSNEHINDPRHTE